MRDSSFDQRTGWIDGELYYDRAPELERGLGAIERLSDHGLTLIEGALADPVRRDRAQELLESSNPYRAMSEQIQGDVMELLNPTGKLVMFPEPASVLASRIAEAVQAIAEAMPHMNTANGYTAAMLVRRAKDPAQALELYYTALALEKISPGWDATAEVQRGLSGSIDWKTVGVAAGGALVGGLFQTALPDLFGMSAPLTKIFENVGKSIGDITGKVANSMLGLDAEGKTIAKPSTGTTTASKPAGTVPAGSGRPQIILMRDPSEKSSEDGIEKYLPWTAAAAAGIALYSSSRK